MRIPFILFGLLCCIQISTAQHQKISSVTLTLNCQFDLLSDKLVLAKDDAIHHYSNINVQLQNNTIDISIRVPKLENQDYCDIKMLALVDGSLVKIPASNLLGDLGKVYVGEEDLKIVWMNVVDHLPKAKGKLQIVLEIDWWGVQFLPLGVRCDHPPAFTTRHKLPYYAVAVVGLGGITTGFVLRGQANKSLDKHLASSTLSELNSEYDNYKDKMNQGQLITYISLGVIAVDVVFYLFRNNLHQRRLRVFEKHCTDNTLTVNPYWEIDKVESKSSIGLHVGYNF